MIQHFADWLVFRLFGMSPESHWSDALNFFIYDTLKILILLFAISLVMGIINSYIPIDRMRRYLATHKMYGLDYVIASFLGVVTPFCSCSSVPLFIGFVKGGLHLGVTLTFLISSPLVSEIAIAMFWGAFGWKVALLYTLSGFLLSIIAGMILGRMRLEAYLTDWAKQAVSEQQLPEAESDTFTLSFRKRLFPIAREAWSIVGSVLIYVIIGIGIGALMHGFIPTNFFEQYISEKTWYAVPLSVLIGVPMYANAAGVVPIMQVLVAKGVPFGTALSFMMAVIALSVPEATMLKKVMTWRLIGIFFGVTTFCIILSGYLFNFLF
ncbi:MAG: permease [Bacteroidales bacterium]